MSNPFIPGGMNNAGGIEVARDLDRMRPFTEPKGDKVSVQPGSNPALARKSISVSDSSEKHAAEVMPNRQGDVLKTHGAASLEAGNKYHGRPQFMPEIRSEGYTLFDLGAVSGNVAINPAMSNGFEMLMTGDIDISPSVAGWPTDAYSKGSANGLDFGITLIIDNENGNEINIPAAHWSVQFTSFPAGYYEIGLGLAWYPGRELRIRAFPYIYPENAIYEG